MLASVLPSNDRADQPVAVLEQTIDHPRSAIAAVFQRMHARPRGSGERRLRSRKKGGQGYAKDDDGAGNPEIDGVGLGVRAVHGRRSRVQGVR